jgi:hypothetical protein
MADEAWRIDALNARGGIAFASYRTADLKDAKANLDVPCYALSAPDFRPEPLTSRALAFASERRGLQLGVWDDGAELAFDDLETVVEFVRRVYLTASGRGGGGGGGGEAPPVPVEVPGGPRPGPPEGEGLGGKVASEFMNVADQFDHAGSWGDTASLKFVAWPKARGHLDVRRGLVDLCAGAAISILNEVVDRAVKPHSEAYPKWHRSLVAATAIVAEFVDGETLREHATYYVSRLEHILPSPDWFKYPRWRWQVGLSGRRDDVLTVLELLPVDRRLAKALGHLQPEQASVFDIVRILAANPKEFAQGLTDAQARFGVLVLAAAVLNQSIGYGFGPFGLEEDTLDGEAIWSWLVAQLPPGHFDERIERLVGNVGHAAVLA